MKGTLRTVALGICAMQFLALTQGCKSPGRLSACSGGMCTIKSVAMNEGAVRQRASDFAYDRLVERQQRTRAPVTGPDGKPILVDRIDPASWEVSRTATRWRLERHLTRDLWQVVVCNPDGSQADALIEVGPVPTDM